MASESETVRLWFGQRRWNLRLWDCGWRLWGVSKGGKWFVGLSIKSYADWSGTALSIENGGTGAREEAQDAWLPIETAPRATTASIYPTYFLMYGVGGYFEDVGSVEKGYREQDGEVCFVNGLPAPEATHWRKMLDGPAIAQQDAQRGEERDDGRG